jgi:hypothetical protein
VLVSGSTINLPMPSPFSWCPKTSPQRSRIGLHRGTTCYCNPFRAPACRERKLCLPHPLVPSYPADGFFTGGRGRQAKSSPLSSAPAHFHNSLHPPTCRSETFRTKVDTSLLHEPFPNTPVRGALQSPPPAEVNNPSTVTPQSFPHQTMPRKAVDDSTEP